MAAKGEFARKIECAVIESGYDPNFILACKYHLENLKKDAESLTVEEYWKRLISIMFINQVENYQRPPRFESDIDENIGWPVPVVPVEIFYSPGAKPSDNFRKKIFFECLKVGDVLECRIFSVPDSNDGYYQLRVVHKYGAPRILEDLNIMVFMPRKENEVQTFHQLDLLRAVVCEIDRKTEGDPRIYVTVHGFLEQSKRKPYLGLIQDLDLSFYVINPNCWGFLTYADYLKSHPQFQQPTLNKPILEHAFGMDLTTIPSFHPAFNGRKCSEDETGKALTRESKLNDARDLLESAVNYMNDGHYNLALIRISTGIDICPEDDLLASRLYMQRAKIYEKIDSPKYSKRGVADLIKALQLNPECEEAMKALADHFYKTAKRMYSKKEYNLAAELVETALVFDQSHSSALLLQKGIKRRHPKPIETFVNLEEETLISLEEKKKQLVTSLKRIGTSENGKNVPKTDFLNLIKKFIL